MLELPVHLKHLAEAMVEQKLLLRILRHAGGILGGGSVLAMLWGNHRISTDLDIMVPARGFDRAQRALQREMAAIRAVKHEHGPYLLAARYVENRHGDIEIVRDELGDKLRERDGELLGEPVAELELRTERVAHIMTKKLARMRRRDTERDHYDLIWCAYQDPETLREALLRETSVRDRQNVVRRTRRGPDQVFSKDTKRVIEPMLRNWKDQLHESWVAIARMPAEPPGSVPALPAYRTRQYGGHDAGR